jgi:hypothetical protein
VHAVFNVKLPVWIAGTNSYFTKVSDAYAQLPASGGIIEAQTVTIAENDVTLGSDKTVTLRGGYDPAYQSQIGFTKFKTTLTVKGGSLVVDRLIIN